MFLTGTPTRQVDGTGAADFLLGGGCRYAIVEKSQERAFVHRAEAIGLRYTRGLRFDGFNLGARRAGFPLRCSGRTSAGVACSRCCPI